VPVCLRAYDVSSSSVTAIDGRSVSVEVVCITSYSTAIKCIALSFLGVTVTVRVQMDLLVL
jgi:hypothetical protein